MCIDTSIESSEQSEYGKVPVPAARPTGISGVSPKHLGVGAQQLPPDSSPAEDIDNNSDDQVDMGIAA